MSAHAHVHPMLRGLLDAMQTWPSDAAEAQRQAYTKLLLRHDWSHEFSDDTDKAQRGRAQLRELRLVQREVDPDFAIWNQHCPKQCVNGARYS